jgi:two-component system, sensor histidine kinase and response regulator
VLIDHQRNSSVADATSGNPGDSPTGDRAEPKEQAKILIVDDRDDKRLAMETIIASLGENVMRATSGKEALKCLLNHDFAVILLDVNMPGMDGFETAHLIRQRKNSEHTPIIFVTGISDTETHVSRGYSLGAVDYILTPVLPEVLRTKVAVFVELYKKTEQLRKQAERLRVAHDELETRVQDRTMQLASANESLQAEIVERRRVEGEIRRLNAELEQRVLDRTTELAEANQELEAFTYSVAHDLQAPLRNIQSYAQLLEEEFGAKMPPETMQYLRRIGTRVKHMAQLVADLLNLSRIAKHELNRQETNLTKIVEEAISNAKAEAKDRDIEWHVLEITPAACDPGLLRQVFANLLSNAVKYTQPRAKARIEIGQTTQNGAAQIYIRDNGVGFDMKFVDKLFGVFQRLHPATDFEGTGVGLATVARIIRKHGGSIWAEGEENKGATFYFTLGDQPKKKQKPPSPAEV